MSGYTLAVKLKYHFGQILSRRKTITWPIVIKNVRHKDVKSTVVIATYGEYSCKIEKIEMNRVEDISDTVDILKMRAEMICTGIDYLEDNLQVYEVDVVNEEVQIRSAKPQRNERNRVLTFFEINLDKKYLIFQKIQKSLIHKKKTEIIEFKLTDEIFYRLLDSLHEIFNKSFHRKKRNRKASLPAINPSPIIGIN